MFVLETQVSRSSSSSSSFLNWLSALIDDAPRWTVRSWACFPLSTRLWMHEGTETELETVCCSFRLRCCVCRHTLPDGEHPRWCSGLFLFVLKWCSMRCYSYASTLHFSFPAETITAAFLSDSFLQILTTIDLYFIYNKAVLSFHAWAHSMTRWIIRCLLRRLETSFVEVGSPFKSILHFKHQVQLIQSDNLFRVKSCLQLAYHIALRSLASVVRAWSNSCRLPSEYLWYFILIADESFSTCTLGRVACWGNWEASSWFQTAFCAVNEDFLRLQLDIDWYIFNDSIVTTNVLLVVELSPRLAHFRWLLVV